MIDRISVLTATGGTDLPSCLSARSPHSRQRLKMVAWFERHNPGERRLSSRGIANGADSAPVSSATYALDGVRLVKAFYNCLLLRRRQWPSRAHGDDVSVIDVVDLVEHETVTASIESWRLSVDRAQGSLDLCPRAIGKRGGRNGELGGCASL